MPWVFDKELLNFMILTLFLCAVRKCYRCRLCCGGVRKLRRRCGVELIWGRILLGVWSETRFISGAGFWNFTRFKGFNTRLVHIVKISRTKALVYGKSLGFSSLRLTLDFNSQFNQIWFIYKCNYLYIF